MITPKFDYEDFVKAAKDMSSTEFTESELSYLARKEYIDEELFKALFVPITIEQGYDDKKCITRDYVAIRDSRRFEYDCMKPKASDFALMNGAYQQDGYSWEMLASELPEIGYYDENGEYQRRSDRILAMGVRPCMRMNIEVFKELIKNDFWRGYFDASVTGDESGKTYHRIDFGEYPMDRVFTSKYNVDDMIREGEYRLTGRRIWGRQITGVGEGLLGFPKLVDFTRCAEYYDASEDDLTTAGSKIVKVLKKRPFLGRRDIVYRNGDRLFNGIDEEYVCVEKISWIIRNWDELPSDINMFGDGSAKYIDLISEKILISGFPYHPAKDRPNSALWQNSTIRGYLNGINVDKIIDNGNPKFSAPNGGNFEYYRNFLNAVFRLPRESINRINKSIVEKVEEKNEDIESQEVKETHEADIKTPMDALTNSYGVRIESKPMTVSDQIKFYIEHGKSFMLHGPSGVGKTRRIEEIDPEYVSIILRNGILPEEVIGKTIFPNGDKSQSGRWVAPVWYLDLCKKCKEEPDKNHVLFIDEITNVRPAEQSLVYDIVLNNQIAPNVGKMPDNVVLVAAGNSMEESSSAYNMPEPLFRRFEGHVYLTPNLKDFSEWGEQFVDGYNQKIHPLVLAFLRCNEDCLYSGYDCDNPPDFAIDPRGWEQVSKIICANNGQIRRELIENKIGKKMAENFIEFAKDSIVERRVLPNTSQDDGMLK